jgi:hypothetical protein
VSQRDDGDWVYIEDFFTLLFGLAGRPSSHHPYRWATSSISSQYGTNSVLVHIATTFEYWFYAIKCKLAVFQVKSCGFMLTTRVN